MPFDRTTFEQRSELVASPKRIEHFITAFVVCDGAYVGKEANMILFGGECLSCHSIFMIVFGMILPSVIRINYHWQYLPSMYFAFSIGVLSGSWANCGFGLVLYSTKKRLSHFKDRHKKKTKKKGQIKKKKDAEPFYYVFSNKKYWDKLNYIHIFKTKLPRQFLLRFAVSLSKLSFRISNVFQSDRFESI